MIDNPSGRSTPNVARQLENQYYRDGRLSANQGRESPAPVPSSVPPPLTPPSGDAYATPVVYSPQQNVHRQPV